MSGASFSRRSAAFILAALAAASIAYACADGGYETSFDPAAGTAFISPANDTRTNFVLLSADRYGTKTADPQKMAKGIVPFEIPYRVLADRLNAPEPDSEYVDPTADWGLSANSRYSWAGGNFGLCHSNGSGARAFNAALNAEPTVSAETKKLLIEGRDQLAKACDAAGSRLFAFQSITDPVGRAYADYLEGARLFYAEEFKYAAPRFASASKAPSAWVAETAKYMAFRNALAAATETTVDEYGTMLPEEKRDPAAIAAAESARQDYLKAYPRGRYRQSAMELSRRIAWLSGDKATLAAAYSSMFGQRPADAMPNLRAMDEVDLKLLPSRDGIGVTDPTLMAVIDLMRLRATSEYDQERSHDGPLLTRADLERQKPVFARDPDLYTFLLASEAFHSRKQAREVLTLIPDAAHQSRFSYLQFSRQLLRGFALEALKDRNARAFWVSLLPGATQPYQRGLIELAIYDHDKAAGMVGRLLETGSPILHPLIRNRIIEEDSDQALLRRQASSGMTQPQRDTALYLLLVNELQHGLYRDFLTDQQLVGKRGSDGDDYGWSYTSYDPSYSDVLTSPPLQKLALTSSTGAGCANIRDTASALAANSQAVRPRLCLAEFVRVKGFDNWNDSWDSQAEKQVHKARNHFPGEPMTRYAIYQAVLRDPAATADDRAFALNRSIRCYAPSGYSSCGDDRPKAVRKAWFDELKSKYGASPWAKELKYYW